MSITLKQKIKADFEFARKHRDKIAISTITMITDRIQKAEKELQAEIDDAAIQKILQTYHKQTKEELEAFQKRGYAEKVATLQEELSLIEAYLPKQLTYSEIVDRVTDIKNTLGDVPKGELIKNAQQSLKGQADPKLITQAIGELLS